MKRLRFAELTNLSLPKTNHVAVALLEIAGLFILKAAKNG